jgi:DNA invertase Pin-like site-specific DNA recombinase
MRTIAYAYSDPLLEPLPSPEGWGQDVDRLYLDIARGTGPERADRPQLEQLLQDCAQTPTHCLRLRRLDELGDTLDEVGDRLDQLEQLGVQLIPTDLALAGEGAGASKADLLRLFRQIQSSHTSRQIRRGHARNRLKALPPPGRAPYGYKRGKDRYLIDRAAAAIVKDFFEHFLLYGSLGRSVRYLATQHGKRISVPTGKYWLTNAAYRGDLSYRDGSMIRDTHPAILSRAEAAQIDRLLRRNRGLAPRTASAACSLAGLATCSQCGLPFTVVSSTSRKGRYQYRYLRVRQCPQQPKCSSLSYAQILEAVIERICTDLAQAVSGLDSSVLGQAKAALEQEILDRQAVVAKLPELTSEGWLDGETAALRHQKLQTEIAQLQDKLAQLPPINLKEIAQAVSIPQFWQDLSEEERRFFFREFIQQIQLTPSEGKDWSLILKFIF